jgi:photosystem II PsbZ protein
VTFIFQLFLLILVLYSLLLVVAVPVLYSSASDQSQGNRLILLGSLVWVGLVLAVGGLNFLK